LIGGGCGVRLEVAVVVNMVVTMKVNTIEVMVEGVVIVVE
jgi:hypothetical protein